MILTLKSSSNTCCKNMMSGGISIKAIKLIILVLTLGMLVAVGAAQDGGQPYEQSYDDGYPYGEEQQSDYGGQPQDRSHDNDFGGHHDWLNPGGVTHYYSWWDRYPKHYATYNYPNYYYNNYWYDPYPIYYYDYYWTYTYPTYSYRYSWNYPPYNYHYWY